MSNCKGEQESVINLPMEIIMERHYKKLPATLFLVLASTANAVSFDCNKATSFAEKEICSNGLLGRLDSALSENYTGMLEADLGASRKALKTEQLNWLKQRNKCTTTECLVQSYRKRLDETCDYGVVSGIHPICTMSDQVQ